MALTALLGSFFFSTAPSPLTEIRLAPGPNPLSVIIFTARDLRLHLIQCARDVFSDMGNLDVAENVFELRRYAVASGNRLAERNGFADHFKVRATGPAELEFL